MHDSLQKVVSDPQSLQYRQSFGQKLAISVVKVVHSAESTSSAEQGWAELLEVLVDASVDASRFATENGRKANRDAFD